MKCLKANRRIVMTIGKAKERVFTFGGVFVGITSVRWWADRSRLRGKPKAAER